MGQMATLLTKKQQGSLPSNSEVNPRREARNMSRLSLYEVVEN